MIRKATIEDYSAVFAMAKKFAEESPYKDLCTITRLRSVVLDCLLSPDRVVFMNEHGMIAGMYTVFIYGSDLNAVELAWWVDPEHRTSGLGKELIQAFEDWAKDNGCKMVTMISLDDDLGKYYEKRGYKLNERAYLKVL